MYELPTAGLVPEPAFPSGRGERISPTHNMRLVRLSTMTDHTPLATLAALFARGEAADRRAILVKILLPLMDQKEAGEWVGDRW